MSTTAQHPDVRGDVTTTLQHGEHGQVASPALAASLQSVLVDLLELTLQTKQAHWNVVGRNFRDTHLILDEVVAVTRLHSDEFAERLRALHVVPDGRSTTVVATTTLPAFPDGEVSVDQVVDLMTTRVDAAVATLRRVHATVDAEDPSTTDLLHAATLQLEKLSWMLASENRTPTAG